MIEPRNQYQTKNKTSILPERVHPRFRITGLISRSLQIHYLVLSVKHASLPNPRDLNCLIVSPIQYWLNTYYTPSTVLGHGKAGIGSVRQSPYPTEDWAGGFYSLELSWIAGQILKRPLEKHDFPLQKRNQAKKVTKKVAKKHILGNGIQFLRLGSLQRWWFRAVPMARSTAQSWRAR